MFFCFLKDRITFDIYSVYKKYLHIILLCKQTFLLFVSFYIS